MNRVLVFFVALLLLFVGASFFWYAANREAVANVGTKTEVDNEYTPPKDQLTEFVLTDQYGKEFGSKELKGKVWLGSFFFADCPGICVQQNAKIAELHHKFRDQGVMIVNITVTPDKDSPVKLLNYANRFGADHETWRFLTTDKDISYVREVGAEFFGLPAADATHTSEVAVFDRSGKMHSTYNVNKGIEFAKLVRKVENLLEETGELINEVDGALEDPSTDATERETELTTETALSQES